MIEKVVKKILPYIMKKQIKKNLDCSVVALENLF